MADETTLSASEVFPPDGSESGTILPHAELGNATAEELTWPTAAANRVGNSTFYDGPPEQGNATDEEWTWQVIAEGWKGSHPRSMATSTAEAPRVPGRMNAIPAVQWRHRAGRR